MSRLTWNDKNGLLRDNQLNTDIDTAKDGGAKALCADPDSFAETYVSVGGNPCAIQICPAYLQKQIGYFYHSLEYFTGPIPCRFAVVLGF